MVTYEVRLTFGALPGAPAVEFLEDAIDVEVLRRRLERQRFPVAGRDMGIPTRVEIKEYRA